MDVFYFTEANNVMMLSIAFEPMSISEIVDIRCYSCFVINVKILNGNDLHAGNDRLQLATGEMSEQMRTKKKTTRLILHQRTYTHFSLVIFIPHILKPFLLLLVLMSIFLYRTSSQMEWFHFMIPK